MIDPFNHSSDSPIDVLVSGLLACLDDRMNIAMEQVEEVIDGVVASRFNDAFIRGNNGNKRSILDWD